MMKSLMAMDPLSKPYLNLHCLIWNCQNPFHPSQATAAKGKPAPKPKVVVPAPGKSHSSREVFDEDEEMKQVENRLGQKTSFLAEEQLGVEGNSYRYIN